MVALREIQEVTSRSITVTLPEGFVAKTVEIIVLPIEEPKGLPEPDIESDAGRLKLAALLLSAPTLTDEDLEEFTDVRAWVTEWRAEDF